MKRNRIGLIGLPMAVIAIVVMLVIPLPTPLLDALISLNITVAVIIMLMTMHVQRPMEFSAFPSVLLVATLFRLALNVSASRLILLHAYAGTVIESFGHFVVGGSLVVGLVVFLILIIIQFVVVTNGAGRVAEVAARFTLDAMPGKQMAIDADLNTGLIKEDEARRRRRDIADEADFYGAMDGAAKFVRGDAIAAVVIVVINLVGGLIIGVVEHHMPIAQAVDTYSLLSIGDGLVSQIPALLLSISTGLIVTRAATADEDDFGSEVLMQFARQFRAIQIAGAVLGVLAFIPGLPHVAFFLAGGAALLIAQRARSVTMRRKQEKEALENKPEPPAAIDSPEQLALEMRVDPLELDLAADLVDLVDPNRGGDLLDRVKGLRRKIASDKGLIVPAVRTRDDINLPPSTYVIKVHGVEVARGTAPPGRVLAIGEPIASLPGESTTEPVFGLPAKWVPAELRQQAVISGSTVVDRSSVITTHLGEVVDAYASQLLSTQQVRQLIDLAKSTDPALVEELASAQLGPIEIQRVLAGLLAERVPIRSLVRILEAVCARARQTKDPEALLEAARTSVGSAIIAQYVNDGELPVIMLDAALEQSLLGDLRAGDEGSQLVTDPGTLEAIVRQVAALAEQAEQQGRSPVLICAAKLRPALHRLLSPVTPRLGVVSVNELTPQVRVHRVGTVSAPSPDLAVPA
jgi:flagellar biosynthesis protein FlhA